MSSANEEIEAVFLEIDKDDIEQKLKAMGAECTGDVLQRHVALDYPGYVLAKDQAWVRLRTSGDDIELAYKRRLGTTSQDGSSNDAGMEEIEVKVDDYERTKVFLLAIGMFEKHEVEKKRTKWHKGDVSFDIDTWPGMPTFLEIEAGSYEEIDDAARELGLNPEEKKICSAMQIYRLYGIDMDEYKKLTFDGLVKK